MTQEKKILPNQKPTNKIRLRHIFEVFSEFSPGDVVVGENTVRYLNVAQMRDTRSIISKSLRSVRKQSEIFVIMTNDIDPHAYDETVGMTQRSEDGGTFVSTEVVTDSQGQKTLISLAFTTKLRDEVRAMLGNPQTEETTSSENHD